MRESGKGGDPGVPPDGFDESPPLGLGDEVVFSLDEVEALTYDVHFAIQQRRPDESALVMRPRACRKRDATGAEVPHPNRQVSKTGEAGVCADCGKEGRTVRAVDVDRSAAERGCELSRFILINGVFTVEKVHVGCVDVVCSWRDQPIRLHAQTRSLQRWVNVEGGSRPSVPAQLRECCARLIDLQSKIATRHANEAKLQKKHDIERWLCDGAMSAPPIRSVSARQSTRPSGSAASKVSLGVRSEGGGVQCVEVVVEDSVLGPRRQALRIDKHLASFITVNRQRIGDENAQFSFKGLRVEKGDTPELLGLQTGDVIRVKRSGKEQEEEKEEKKE